MALLEVKNLTKTFREKTAVQHLSFSLKEGRCVALLGPNGAGKTTTLSMLSGLIKPTSGEIAFEGLKEHEDFRNFLGYLPQSVAFYGWMSGWEYLMYVGRLAQHPKREVARRADELLERVGLAESKHRRIVGYSGGMKQRLGLAQALMHQPKLLMLDEPVSALDPIGRREVLELLKKLKQQTTILFSTHVLHDAEEICDDILIIRDGQIVISGELNQIRKQYAQPILELEISELAQQPLEKWMAKWKDWGAKTEIKGTKVRLTVVNTGDLDSFRRSLLQQVVEENIPITRFAIGYSTLEDLFMKVVMA